MNKKHLLFSILGTFGMASTLTLVVEHVRAAGIPTPGTLTYSGTLANPDGTPVTATSKNIGITAYDAATAGNMVPDCTVASKSVNVALGQFQVALPDTCAARVQATSNLWIEVTVDGASLGRTKLGAVPYAVEAGHAVAADLATNATTANAAAGALDTRVTTVESATSNLQRPGSVVATAGSSCPTGTLLADGSSILRTGPYAALFAAIGSTYGAADGSHFNLPDYRGMFLRGVGTNGTATRANGGPVAGNALGTSQTDQMQGHWHSVVGVSSGSGTYTTLPFAAYGVSPNQDPSTGLAAHAAESDGTNGPPRTGAENRPANMSVTFCVAY